MKPGASWFLLYLLSLALTCSVAWAQNLELVESFPVGTDFDQSDIRDTQEVWLEIINGAQKELLWQTFYLAHEAGKSTEPVLQALQSAARRGVKIRFLVDERFLKTYPETLGALSKLENIEVRTSPLGRWFGGVMHAKMILADGKIGFIGSQNFDWRSLEHIRELGILFEDRDLVESYATVFNWEWSHFELASAPTDLPAMEPKQHSLGTSLVQATVSPNALNSDPELGDEFQILELLRGAQSSIRIALLSYSPTDHSGKEFYPDLDNAIRAAATRGVKVEILVSHWEERKKSLDHLLSLDALDNVELRACRIPLTAEGEIPFARVHHSKYLVVDESKAWLGTSNWDKGYFHESRNYGLVFFDGPIPTRLFKLFAFDWQRSTALSKSSHS